MQTQLKELYVSLNTPDYLSVEFFYDSESADLFLVFHNLFLLIWKS